VSRGKFLGEFRTRKLFPGDRVTSLSLFPFVETWQKSSHFGLTLIEFPPSDPSRNSGWIWKCTVC